MAQERRDSTAVAVREAPQGAETRYLQSLRPILLQATNARTSWVRALNEAAGRSDLAAATAEIVQVAIGQGGLLVDARRQLSKIDVPPDYQTMHATIESWLRHLEHSCQIVAHTRGALTPEMIARVRDVLHTAAADADRFNAERAAIAAVAVEVARPSEARPRVIARPREIRAMIIAVVVLLVVLLAGGVGSGALPSSAPPTATTVSAANATATAQALVAAGAQRKIFTLAEIQQRLDQEITNRNVAYQQATVRLTPPDRIIVSGRINGPNGPIVVDVEIQLSLEAGKPKLLTQGIRAAGVQVPREAFDALSKRADEGNQELLGQLKPGEQVLRVVVEPSQIVADLTPAKPGA